jgi:hypothetical protein
VVSGISCGSAFLWFGQFRPNCADTILCRCPKNPIPSCAASADPPTIFVAPLIAFPYYYHWLPLLFRYHYQLNRLHFTDGACPASSLLYLYQRHSSPGCHYQPFLLTLQFNTPDPAAGCSPFNFQIHQLQIPLTDVLHTGVGH